MQVKALLDVDMVALEATDKVTLMLDLTAPQNPTHASRPGQAVQVVLDRSGSMDGAPLDAAKGSLLKLIDRLAPQDSFGLVAFDDNALVIAPMRTMAGLMKAVPQSLAYGLSALIDSKGGAPVSATKTEEAEAPAPAEAEAEAPAAEATTEEAPEVASDEVTAEAEALAPEASEEAPAAE